ncbi:Transporter/ MFS family protein/Hexose [Giardia duodenalis assemblage B]|uniref:Transporter/ MFS family protein/Hexose n=1 Tax=Giardia duodenalis assemblage B TaxID=1394984 RepID=A0A132NX61_GIAIN|nr:Transporter/ MFS family protein/Hexose [Giardia intestinalis assemblage B]
MGMKDSYATNYPNTCVFFIFVLFTGLTMASTFTNMGAPIQDLYSIAVGAKYKYNGGNTEKDPLSTSVTAAFSAAFFVGAFVGSLLTFPIVERLGRKLSTIIFCVSTIVLTALMLVPTHWAYLIVIRVLAGFPASCIQTVTPLWISETCPPHRRGIATVGIQLFLTLGILLSYILEWGLISVCRGKAINYGTTTETDPYGLSKKCTGPNLWILAFILTIVYLVGLLVFCFFIPEKILSSTPAQEPTNSTDQSINPTSTELNATSVEVKTITMEQSQKPAQDDTDSASFKDCFTRKDYRRCLAISIILPFLQQFTGINAVILFAGTFFSAAKMPDPALIGAIIIGAWNFTSTIVAIPIVERMGRRFLLFLGTFILIAMLVMLIPVYVVSNNNKGTAVLAFIMLGVLLYIFGFAIAPGPLVFTICGEIFPKAARVKFNSIAFAMHKLSSIIVVFTFPYMQDKLWLAFTIYLVVTIFFTILSWYIIPETKGKTLDEIEEVVVNETVFEKFDMCGHVK